MMEHMSRQMDTLRHILRMQEDKMGKAGILVESHADILDRMFWAEVPEAGKKSVLLSSEAACVPPRNIRQFVEVLLERGRQETADRDSEELRRMPRRQGRGTAPARPRLGWARLADLYPRLGGQLDGTCHPQVGESSCTRNDPEIQSLLSAAFVRLS